MLHLSSIQLCLRKLQGPNITRTRSLKWKIASLIPLDSDDQVARAQASLMRTLLPTMLVLLTTCMRSAPLQAASKMQRNSAFLKHLEPLPTRRQWNETKPTAFRMQWESKVYHIDGLHQVLISVLQTGQSSLSWDSSKTWCQPRMYVSESIILKYDLSLILNNIQEGVLVL